MSFLRDVETVVGHEYITTTNDDTESATRNTLGISRTIIGIARPQTVSQVTDIVCAARKHKVPLYPISRGQNIGYGEKLPPKDGMLILDLGLINAIRDFDPRSGEVTVEPGVTQEQLHSFLKEQEVQYWADMTGGPLRASIVGNILEGGFGHTPLGYHRKHIVYVEAILGTGEFLKTGDFPNLGPNIASLFVQSNFGVVTAIRIPLYPEPPHVEIFVVQFDTTGDFKENLEKLRLLRQQGVIQGLLHVGNAMRAFMSLDTFPADLPADHVMDDRECVERMSTVFNKAGMWTAFGALYGNAKHIQESKKIITTTLTKRSRCRFFSERQFRVLEWLVRHLVPSFVKGRAQVLKSLYSIRELYELTKGVPTDEPTRNILWKTDTQDTCGLIWYSPVIKADTSAFDTLLFVASSIFKKYQFEMPISLTLINHTHLVGVLNISFDRNDQAEVLRAHQAYEELSCSMADAGIKPYRLGVLGLGVHSIPEDRMKTLRSIKSALDPDNIIAPGRYGIDLAT